MRSAAILNVLCFVEQKHLNATGARDFDSARRGSGNRARIGVRLYHKLNLIDHLVQDLRYAVSAFVRA